MALQGSPLLPMLLAALLVLLGASANPGEYRRFLRQHVDPNPSGRDDAYCNQRMRWMMNEDRMMYQNDTHCKEMNTFVHRNSNAIRAICTPQGGQDYRTKSGQLMRQSLRPFQVTNCRHLGGTPLNNCRYRASHGSRTIVIACDEDGFPKHLHETQI